MATRGSRSGDRFSGVKRTPFTPRNNTKADWRPLGDKVVKMPPSDVPNRIICEVRGLNRVVYGISGRPPAAFEWE